MDLLTQDACPDLSYREIPLTRGLLSLVDAEDYEWLSQFSWRAVASGKDFYARRALPIQDGRRPGIDMHREIMGLKARRPAQGRPSKP